VLVVTRPMCIGTVEKRLKSGWYWDAAHCAREIQQVWTNAKMYNPDSHPVHQWAVKLEMLVAHIWISFSGTGKMFVSCGRLVWQMEKYSVCDMRRFHLKLI